MSTMIQPTPTDVAPEMRAPTSTPIPDLAFDVPHAEQADPWCITPDQAVDLLEGAPWRRLVVMGDSVAAGVGDPVDGYLDQSWADRLAATLDRVNPGLRYLNLGQRELRAVEVRQEQVGPAIAFRPDLAIVVCGGNDMLRRSFDPAAVEHELQIIIGRLRQQGADILTFGLLDISKAPFVPDEMREGLRERLHLLGELTRRVSRNHGGMHVDFLPHPLAGDESIYSADLLHANRRGHAVVATETVRGLGLRLRSRQRRAG